MSNIVTALGRVETENLCALFFVIKEYDREYSDHYYRADRRKSNEYVPGKSVPVICKKEKGV